MFVKICGTTTEEDALLAVALGADAVGFVLAPSPRQVSVGRVSDIVKRLPPEILTVAVVRDMSADEVLDIVMQTGVRGVQLHGSESPHTVETIKAKLPLVVIKAFAAAGKAVREADKYGADIVLLDAPSPGSGQVFDWRLADGVPDGIRLMLAGGLNPSNVADAIEAVHPWGVDVASGVEVEPGRKDPRKLREFVLRAKEAKDSIHPRPNREVEGPYDWQEEL